MLNMNYYKLDYSNDLKSIGTSGPQIKGIDPKCNYHVNAPYSFKKIKHMETIQEHIRLPDMLLNKKAKWTDLMSCSLLSRNFRVVSYDFYDFLSDYKLDKYQVMNIKLTKNEIIKNYKALYFIKRYEHIFTDWKRCSFGLVNKDFALIKDILEEYTFQNFEDYKRKRSFIFREDKYKLKNLIVRYNRDIELDFFRCLYPTSGYFCSERLKEGIIEKGFTGFRFEEVIDLE